MRCPDINRFLDAMDAGGLPADLAAHLERCALCRSRLRILEELPAALRPDPIDPVERERILHAAMEGFRSAKRAERAPVSMGKVVASGVLAFLGTLGLIVLTGAGGGAGPVAPLLLASLGGTGTAIYLRWWVWPGKSDDAWVQELPERRDEP